MTAEEIRAAFSPNQNRVELTLEGIVRTGDEAALRTYIQQSPRRLTECDKDGRSLLMLLIIGGAYGLAKALLQSFKPKIDHADIFGRTALHYAARSRDLDLVMALRAQWATLTVKDREGWFPLHYAILDESIDLIDHLGPCEFIPNTFTPLHLAAGASPQVLSRVLALAKNPLVRDERGMTALHHAVLSKTAAENVRILLPACSNVNLEDANGCTALYLACQASIQPVVELLLGRGADPKIGRSPLLQAFLNGSREIARLLIERGAETEILLENDNLLDVAAALKDDEFCRLLEPITRKSALYNYLSQSKPPAKSTFFLSRFTSISLPQNVHAALLQEDTDIEMLKANLPQAAWEGRNELGETPFLYCCKRATVPQVERLLDCPIDVSAKDAKGSSALQISLEADNRLVFYYLIRRFQFLINEPNREGETALHVAVRKGNLLAIIKLLQFGADITLLGRDKNSVLHLLSDCIQSDGVLLANIIDLLLAKKANLLEAQNGRRETPVQYAWQRNSLVFAHLVKRGANLDALDGEEKTLLIRACEFNFYSKAEELVLAGASRNVRGITSPLLAACKQVNEQMVALLLSRGVGRAQPKPSKRANVNQKVHGVRALPLITTSLLAIENYAESPAYKIFQMLLNHGATPDKGMDMEGSTKEKPLKETPLTLAVQRKLPYAVRDLLAAGASADLKPKGSHKPLTYAKRLNLPAIVQQLKPAGGGSLSSSTEGGPAAATASPASGSREAAPRAVLQRTTSVQRLGKLVKGILIISTAKK